MFKAFEINSPEYIKIHDLVNRSYGSATDYNCIECDNQAHDWAWQHGENPSIVSSYKEMCRSCHLQYDYTEERRNKISMSLMGHEVSKSVKLKISNTLLGHEGMKGQLNGQAKLTENDVIEIRAKYSTGRYSHKDLALIYGVSRSTITAILNNRLWRHV